MKAAVAVLSLVCWRVAGYGGVIKSRPLAVAASFVRGEKQYELSKHLGNVLVTISDKKVAVENGTPGCPPAIVSM